MMAMISACRKKRTKNVFMVNGLLITSFVLFVFSALLAEEDFTLDTDVSLSSEILETLEKLKEKPLDINSATFKELLQIPYITPVLALRIEDYRKKNGVFNSSDDLLTIAGFNEPLLAKISPFITVKKKHILLKRGTLNWKTTWSTAYPTEEGYLGNSSKLSNKIRYRNEPFEAGLGAYKDAYERSYFDFFTFYALARMEGLSIIAGDYGIDIGERLILGYPGFIFKSSGIIKSKEAILVPYRSGFEDFSLRGCALQKDWKMLRGGAFFSCKKLDATVDDSIVKRALYDCEYHRTETASKKKDRLEERLIGGFFGTGGDRFRLTITSLAAEYDKPVEPDSVHYYRFRGKGYGLTGLHAFFGREQISCWSEIAYSPTTKGTGTIIGMSCKPQKTTVSILYRNYSEKFYSPRAFAFSESEVRNEEGFYSYIASRLPHGFNFKAYIDIFSRPYPTYFNQLSTKGNALFASCEKKILKTTVYMRYKRREKNSYQWEAMNVRYERHNIRLSLKTAINKMNRFTMLWEGSIFSVPDASLQEKGNLLSLSFRSSLLENTSFETGFVFFSTESYNSRIYLFINDIPGFMYTRPFYDNGTDFYILFKAKAINNFRFYCKLEIEHKEGENERTYKVGLEWR